MRQRRKTYTCAQCQVEYDSVLDYLEHRNGCAKSPERERQAQHRVGMYITDEERKNFQDIYERDQASLKKFLRGEF
jgi:hypothetical protein